MSKFNFHIVKQKLAQTKRELPIVLANQAQNYFAGTFEKGGIGDEKWQEVKRRTPGTSEYKYPKAKGLQRRTSPILVGAGWKKRGGTLRRRVARSIANAQWHQVRLVVDLPYAKAQNEGTDDIPARPYIKQTKELTGMQEKTINKTMNKIWK
jgi:hypothetical protein